MMARIQVAPGVKVKASAGRLLEVSEAGKTDEAGHETDTDQEACNQQDQSRRLTSSSADMYEVEFGVHQIHLSSKRAITLYNSKEDCLPTDTHGYYSVQHEPAGTDIERAAASERERVATCLSRNISRSFDADGVGHTHEGHANSRSNYWHGASTIPTAICHPVFNRQLNTRLLPSFPALQN